MRQVVFELDGAQFKQDKPTVLRYNGREMTLVRGNDMILMLMQMEAKWIRKGLHPEFPMIYEPDPVTTIPRLLLSKYKGRVIKEPDALPVRSDVKY